MNEQVRAAVVGYDKPEPLLIIEPFYCTCTHNNSPWPVTWPSIYYVPFIIFWEDILRKVKRYALQDIHYTTNLPVRYKNNKKLFKIPITSPITSNLVLYCPVIRLKTQHRELKTVFILLCRRRRYRFPAFLRVFSQAFAVCFALL